MGTHREVSELIGTCSESQQDSPGLSGTQRDPSKRPSGRMTSGLIETHRDSSGLIGTPRDGHRDSSGPIGTHRDPSCI